MKKLIFNKLLKLKKKYIKTKIILIKSNYLINQKIFNKILIKNLKLKKINKLFKKWLKIKISIKSTKFLLKDYEFYKLAKEELIKLKKKNISLNFKLKKNLLFNYKKKNINCFIEIRAATGGNEASLFAKNLFRMYNKFAEINKWKTKVINLINTNNGGYKEIIIKLYNKNAYNYLKFESGGHRVQRIPITENQGRIHTSTCTVAVIKEKNKKKIIKINNNDLRIDTFKSSGAGGQHVNKTDSAIRLTHIPTNIVIECQNERSQHKNKKIAFKLLNIKLNYIKEKKYKKKESINRKYLLGTGERSDRVRTYNFIKQRVTDHKTNISIFKLKDIMNGNLNLILIPIFKIYHLKKIKNFI